MAKTSKKYQGAKATKRIKKSTIGVINKEKGLFGKVLKQNPFKTEKGTARSLKAMAKNMSAYGTKFAYNSDIQKAYIESVQDVLGLTDREFSEIFKIEQVTHKGKSGVENIIDKVTVMPDALKTTFIQETIKQEQEKKYIKKLDAEGNPIQIEKHSRLRNFYETTQTPEAQRQAILEQIEKGVSITGAEKYADFEAYKEQNKVLYDGLKGKELEKKLNIMEKEFNTAKEAALRKEMAQRASDQLQKKYTKDKQGLTEIDQTFKTMSEGLNSGILTGDFWDNLVHHDGRIISYEELEFAKAYLEDFDNIEEI